MTLSASGILLATGHQDGAIRLWNLGVLELTGFAECVAVLRTEPCHISAVAFSPDGSSLLSRAIRLASTEHRRDGIVQLWDVNAAIKATSSPSDQETP
jgi:WD40 repeat protein